MLIQIHGLPAISRLSRLIIKQNTGSVLKVWVLIIKQNTVSVPFFYLLRITNCSRYVASLFVIAFSLFMRQFYSRVLVVSAYRVSS